MGKALNPAYEGYIVKVKPESGEAFCPACGSKPISPENCAKCRGQRAMATFCPQCDMDCGCEEWQ